MQLAEFNTLEKEEAASVLSKCCGATNWVDRMMQLRPFSTQQELLEKADTIWFNECLENDWLEAFTHHPKIGDLKSLEGKFASTKDLAGSEQASVQQADSAIIAALAEGNQAYENKFGFIFIVCATGKSAGEMLALLNNRLPNNYKQELKIAMAEQAKITKLRLQKLLS